MNHLDHPMLVSLLGAALAVAACGDDGGRSQTPSSSSSSASSGTGGGGGSGGGSGGSGGEGGSGVAPIAVQFEARVGDTAFSCGSTFDGVGSATTSIRITDFRLYVHDLRLLRSDGSEVPVALEQDALWQHQNLALLDFEDGTGTCANGTQETNTALRGIAPAGAYDGVAFKLGVPFELNHLDRASAPSPLNLSGLFWNWNDGYKFVRVDAVPVAGQDSFLFHLGSTGCVAGPNNTVTSCARPNVAEVVLRGFDPATTGIVVDYAAVVAANDLSTDAGGAPGCMSGGNDPDCPPIFERLGLNIEDGSSNPETQKLFRAR